MHFVTFLRPMIGALLLVTGALPAHAAPFTNGSFENAADLQGTRTIIPAGSGPAGWINGNTGTQVFQASMTDDLAARDGGFYVSFGHNSSTGGRLSQTFDTQVGTTYEVTYFLASQQGPSTDQRATVTVYDGGGTNNASALASESNDILGSAQTGWVAGKPVRFVARSTTSTITLLDATPEGGGQAANWAVDQVSVTPASGTPVTPTPPTPTPPTPPAATLPSFTATVSGQAFLQTLVGNLRVGSADVGKPTKVYVLVALQNGLILAKSGTGNQWVLITQNFEDVPFVQDITPTAEAVQVPIYANTNLRGLGAVVYLGYGASLADVITRQQFGLIHTQP